MESSVPPQMIDDYDAFDWAEAVKVLDAYETTNRSSSSATTTSTATPFQNCNSHTVSCPKIENKKPTSSRQSTLDRFIGLTGVKSTIREAKCDALDDAFCNDETISGVSIDPEAAKTWIYPESPPVRDYQVSITKTALFSNTLVSLPTGLGKTLIAAVVMYNYYRWFPKGKIVFTAPSRPLVTQQIEACHNIVGIPQELEVDLTGQTNPTKRVSLWKDKQIFFVTPQILEKDIKSGSCPVNELVCLVFDEAHHASGNYPYCVVVRELMSMAINLRILALTATPGGDHQTVQQVIDNLQISSLEYRSESDHDVISYVHAREVEVIQVEMGKEAVEVNKLLMDVIRVYIRKLSVTGLLPNRDPQTLSLLDFLNIKEKFHQFPPQGLDQSQYGEVDAIISVLITLYYIRKWLSAHGIRSALKMLEDKLKQGYFASLLSRNENIHKAKVLMKHNLSHGSLSPKFSKLLQVLVEHFKKHDPQKSRVIIFSHYRESVSDIMSSLATIGEHVKAMEFVGQNSGKTSKGQSQKVQQAVLQKFRDGGYNVIVATSIGEEGLDIMEVDLVICFDANISPLRMIQRMGRTGRKTKGRVVVLACGGIELNGYKSKQAKGKAVSKHMRNAGKSFLFHPSPRMVPHVFKPEQKVVKFTIEEYVPRGKKVKVDDAIQIPKYKLKLTDAENHLLQKYFQPAATEDDKWRPSLIAFPHFQAFPSRVHGIAHSMRTSVLIDTMQYLQGLSFNGLDEEASGECFKGETVDLDHHSSNTREDDVAGKEAETDTSSFMDVSKTEETHHSFLFESGFTTVDSNGNISILCVPVFPLKPFSPIKNSMQQNTLFLNRPKFDNSGLLKTSSEDHPEIALDVHSLNDMPEEDELDDGIFQGEICSSEVLARVNDTVIPDFHSDEDGDLSPRLINLLISGVVPESPVNTCTPNKATDVDNTSISFVQSTPDKETGIPEISLLNNAIDIDKGASASKFVGEIKTPQTNLSTKSCSKDWILSSGEKSVSQPKKKLKRLRRVCDIKNGKEEFVSHSSVPVSRSYAPSDHAYDKHGRGGRKLLNDARIFIDDEAEASSEEACDDDDEEGEDCYGGSFIDDRINLTVAATQAETAQIDMMAIYRRSLLTQSPIVDFSPDNAVSADDVATNPSPHTNGHSSSSSLISLTSSGHLSTKRLSSEPVSTPTDGPANETKRRKSNFSQGGCGPLPVCNLEKEIFLKPEEAAAATGGRETTDEVDVDDDEFFQGIDLDALVEQASKQLKTKSNLSIEKPKNQDLDFLGSPSFDLGI